MTNREGALIGRSDEDLLGSLQAGDTESLGALVARWEQPLYRFVYRLLPRREEAQDICQETFLRILRKSHHFRKGGKFSTWMYQIALNLCRDHARRRRRLGTVFTEGPFEEDWTPAPESRPGGSGDPSKVVERRENREAVGRALESIPAEQREVLVMKEFEGMKFREIATIVGCPESTVKSRMYYGLRGLRDALIENGVHRS
jgi:RNA polymerase sigma-70 factor (ECF subfamily)